MRFRSQKHVRWYVAGALIILILHITGVIAPIERRFRSLLDVPITYLYSQVQSVRIYLAHNKIQDTAADELPAISRERDVYRTRVSLVEAENIALRKELNYPERNSWKTVGAEVISKTTDISEQALIINRGARDGVSEKQIVYTEQGVLVGEVSVVQEDRAVVRLINDRLSRTGVLLAKNGRSAGIAEGGYGLGVRLSLIPPQEVVEVGDLLVTNDVSEFMPRGLLIGKVTSVARETYEPFQHALIETAIPYEHIKYVSVIIKK